MLKEGLVSVGTRGASGDDMMTVMGTIGDNKYRYQPIESCQDYYANFDNPTDPGDSVHLSRILEWYKNYFVAGEEVDATVSSGASLLMPIGFLKAIRNLSDLSNGRRAIIIGGDKGASNPNRFRGLSDPHIAFHGSFSMMVNFHAIKLYCISRGGFALMDNQEEASLMVNAFVLTGEEDTSTNDVIGSNGERQSKYRYLCNAFEDNVNSFSPNDFYLMQRALKEESSKPTLASIVSLLKLSNWDTEIFFKFRDNILAEIPRATHGLRNDLERGAKRIWDQYYHLENEKDVAFELGRLLFGLHYFEQSLEFYQLSLDLFGFHHVTHHNQGLCNSSLNKYDAAAICFKKSLELKPDYEKAAIWLEKVKEAQISSLD